MGDLKARINRILNKRVFGDKKLVGLDLGQHSLKLVQFNSGKGKILNLWKAILIPIRNSKDETLSKEILEERLVKLFSAYYKAEPSLGSEINTIVQGTHTICQYLELPKVIGDELDTAVYSQAIKYIPFPIEQVIINYVTIPPITHNDKKTAVFFVAALKDTVDAYTNLLKKCNLEVLRVESPVLPLTREFSVNHKVPADKFYALVNAGFKYTYIVIVRDGFPYYAREFSIAGRDFTYAFQMGEQATWQSAEKYKLEYDTNFREAAIEPFLIKWMEEIKKSISFFKAQFADQGNVDVEKVFLSGGTASWKNLDNRLSEHLGIPIQTDFWDRLKYADYEYDQKEVGSYFYNVAVGLAVEN